MNKDFLPHLQGMRAVAVLAVVLFHAFPNVLPGGFIGVDVFFVISGYLISGIIYRGLAKNRFSFVEFYVRRIKRIFPALILMMVCCLMFGYVVLLPQELEQLGTHAAGGAGFISNLLLWREAGYFDNSGASKPLLHLWSLGVEEQFYIVWPIFLVLAWKQRKVFVPLTIALALASFAYNVTQVNGNPLAAFYSPLSRFWELAVGSLLAYRHFCRDHGTPVPYKPGSGRLTAAGVALLLIGFYVVSAANPYPGVWALIPVAATALLLEAGPDAPINRTLLSNSFMLWIGSISYPLYLWHWPLFSYAHILQSGQPSIATRVMAMMASVLLAHLTWIVIERRVKVSANPRRLAGALAGLMVLTAGAGYAIDRQDGYPQREVANLGKYLPQTIKPRPPAPPPSALAQQAAYPDVQMAPDTPETTAALKSMRRQMKADAGFINKIWLEKNQLQRFGSCHIYDLFNIPMTFDAYLAISPKCTRLAPDRKNILVYGDSAATELYLALARAYPEANFVQITGSGCKPFHAAYQDKEHRCVKLLDFALNLAQQGQFDGVVVASSWRDDFAMALPELQRFQGKGKLILVGPPLMFSEEVSKTIQRIDSDQSLSATVGAMKDMVNVGYSADMLAFAKLNGFTYLDRMQLYCQGGCPLISPKGIPMILDTFHLTMPGIDELGRRIKAARSLESILPPEG